MLLGLAIALNKMLPPSSRHYESGVCPGIYWLKVEVVYILRGAAGRSGGATRGKRGHVGEKTVMYEFITEYDLEDHARVREFLTNGLACSVQ
jgi:hypothetical protein